MRYTERFKKAKGETFHQKGQKVWMLKDWSVTVKPQRGKSLGEVAKDSVYPDMWVDVDCWNKDQFINYCNKDLPQHVKDATRRKVLANMNRKHKPRGPRI